MGKKSMMNKMLLIFALPPALVQFTELSDPAFI